MSKFCEHSGFQYRHHFVYTTLLITPYSLKKDIHLSEIRYPLPAHYLDPRQICHHLADLPAGLF
jgi:hypothetical protein